MGSTCALEQARALGVAVVFFFSDLLLMVIVVLVMVVAGGGREEGHRMLDLDIMARKSKGAALIDHSAHSHDLRTR